MRAIELWRDCCYAARALRKARGFTLAAVLILGVVIGAATFCFSELNSFVLQPLAGVSDAGSLVAVQTTVPFPVYESFRDVSGEFSDVSAYLNGVPFVWNDQRPAIRMTGEIVTPNYFRTLGAKSVRGRLFGEDEEKPLAASVAVISERFWKERLGAAPNVVGQIVHFNGSARSEEHTS